jgi:cbb3-type cytochrome oxidase maturation protein
MSYLAWLVPIALGMGFGGLLGFIWSMRSGQYDDLDGAAERVLLADASEGPLQDELHRAASPSGIEAAQPTTRRPGA